MGPSLDVCLRFCTANIMTCSDVIKIGPSKSKSNRSPCSGRIDFIAEQAHPLGFHIVGVQESTAKPSRFRSGALLRLVAGACPRRNRRVELWINMELPFVSNAGDEHRLSSDDATLITEGHGFALFRLSATFCKYDVLVGHSPHVGRPKEERRLFWSEVSSAAHSRRSSDKLPMPRSEMWNPRLSALAGQRKSVSMVCCCIGFFGRRNSFYRRLLITFTMAKISHSQFLTVPNCDEFSLLCPLIWRLGYPIPL